MFVVWCAFVASNKYYIHTYIHCIYVCKGIKFHCCEPRFPHVRFREHQNVKISQCIMYNLMSLKLRTRNLPSLQGCFSVMLLIPGPDLGGKNVLKTVEKAIWHKKADDMNGIRVFCHWIYFHLRSKIFYGPFTGAIAPIRHWLGFKSEQVAYTLTISGCPVDKFASSVLRYDTIRDAILTCARKPTWIGLIYRTETTTKNCKTEK